MNAASPPCIELPLGICEGHFTSPDGLAHFRKRKAEQTRREQAEARQAKRNGGKRLGTVELHQCAVSELHGVVPSASVDAVITDPPYERKALPEYGNLAAFACHALKPGGVLIAMAGSLYLPEVIASMVSHAGLTYRMVRRLGYGRQHRPKLHCPRKAEMEAVASVPQEAANQESRRVVH